MVEGREPQVIELARLPAFFSTEKRKNVVLMNDPLYREYRDFVRQANRELPDFDEYTALVARDALTAAHNLDAHPYQL